MIDRKKVIKELMQLHGSKETMDIISETISLLKEHKALPIVYQNNEYTGLPMALCPSCGEHLVQFHSGVDGKESKFCYYCGQEVQW